MFFLPKIREYLQPKTSLGEMSLKKRKKLEKGAHGVLMSTCAHESLMSMLMKFPCARAHGGVTRTTTLGQYASRRVLWALVEFHNDQKKCSKMFRGARECIMYKWYFSLDFSRKS